MDGTGTGGPGTVVVADSACGLSPARARSLGVEIVPFVLVVDGRSLRDGIDIAPDAFFASLPSLRELPTTSAPSPGEFLARFEPAWAAGHPVLCVTAASAVTASYSAALLAAEERGGAVEVVDSGQASGGEALVVTAAARRAAAGASVDDVAAEARTVAAKVKLVATIEHFTYLRRSGRVKAVAALAAEALHLKPVFTMQRGEIGPSGRPLGRKESLARILSTLEADALDHPGAALHVAALHAACPLDAERLLDGVAALDPVEAETTEFTPVMGTHTGPGTCGLAWWWEA